MTSEQAIDHITAIAQQFVNQLPPIVAKSVARDAQEAITVLGKLAKPSQSTNDGG
jgi:hypothetical protein